MTKSKRIRIQSISYAPSLTKQSFKKECDINEIMLKFQKSGAINHYNTHQPQYDDIQSIDLLDAQLIIANANTMFEELPSSIRKRFENDPAKFYDFVQDDKNLDEMYDLGLKNDPKPIIPLSDNVPDTPLLKPAPADSTPQTPSDT